MKNPDSHIFLYAKGWYQRSEDSFGDLRKIISHRNGVEEKYLFDYDVLEVVTEIAFPFIDKQKFKQLMLDVMDLYGWRNKFSIKERTLAGLLSILRSTPVKKGNQTLIPLDKPDFNILPRHVESK